MTYKEAKQKIQLEICVKRNKYTSCMSYCKDCEIKIAKEAIEKAEKYKWHDLRKNPDDLPEDNKLIVICSVSSITGSKAYDAINWKKNFKPLKNEISWAYFDPFEDEEE